MTPAYTVSEDHGRFGRYEVRGELGRGISTVYDGWDPTLQRRVAIKVIRLQDAQQTAVHYKLIRFRREAQVTSGLVHANIVGLYDYDEGTDLAYTVMECVEGQSLDKVLTHRRRLPLPEALSIMRGLLSALSYVHVRGIVHRDIKPANLILTQDDAIKLTDFGIAHTESSKLTEEGLAIGTLAYMSPEQHAGRPVDARSDLFSAGVLLQEMLTGRSPFEGAPAEAIRRPLTAADVDLPEATRSRLDAVLAKAMAKRPQDRFADAASFDTALRQATESRQVAVAAPPIRLLVALGVLALVLGAVGHGVYRWFTRPPADPRAPVAAAAASVPCTLVTVTGGVGEAPLTVTGLAGVQAQGPLQAAVVRATDQPVAWHLTTFQGPYCGVLDMLRPLAPQSGGQARGLEVRLPGGRTAFEGGEPLRANVTMPDFAAHLRLDYLSQSGSILHMAPGDGFPDLALPARAHQVVGTPTSAFPGWDFQAPFGRDMVLAVATPAALPVSIPGESEDDAASYLAKLRSALTAAAARHETVAATVLLVDTMAGASH